ncbi:CAP domain-containing protein [Petroclostridium sp. X23]|uniref:CAP domain-containing protein n=1 Tax=Petroclostridium sp. X23 TaxID=3045146 RepID=UPI0024AD9F6F|nr:CAP domain-containing protein [Petroclostridium sp. X23]WHH60883.1 CAP domain-containing protein [Petroclostridium sp. X23]
MMFNSKKLGGIFTKRRLYILTLIVLLLFTVSCAQKAVKGVESSVAKEGDIKRVKVTAERAEVRTGCSNDTPVIQTSDKNSTLDVVNKVEDWYAVKLPNKQIGFIPQNQCTPVVVEDNKTGATPATPGTTPGTTVGTTPGRTNGTTPGTTPGTTGTTPKTTPKTTPGTTTGTTPGTTQGTTPQIPDNTKNNSTTLTSQEQEMLRLVNEARSQNGVAPLTIDMELTNVARIKSQDMIDNNYFSHNSPTYGSPFDMMKDFGIEYVRAGENIAGNQTVQKAHEALMNSPGHRKNILSPDFTHIGLGIKSGGSYGNMFTQMFISKPK